jgi:DNA-directed RNA polymerase subunit RPC12/RpoP
MIIIQEICNRCGKKINKEVDSAENRYWCPKCKVFIANRNFDGRKVK